MIRPATDRQVLVLSVVARQGGNGQVTVPAPDLRALLARLERAETGLDPLPVRVDVGGPALGFPVHQSLGLVPAVATLVKMFGPPPAPAPQR